MVVESVWHNDIIERDVESCSGSLICASPELIVDPKLLMGELMQEIKLAIFLNDSNEQSYEGRIV
jgi:hypothetical protein